MAEVGTSETILTEERVRRTCAEASVKQLVRAMGKTGQLGRIVAEQGEKLRL